MTLKTQPVDPDVWVARNTGMEAGLQHRTKARRALLALVVCVVLVGGSGCRGPRSRGPTVQAAETGTPAELAPGQVFRFVEHFTGGAPPAPRGRRTDGPYRLALGEVHQPVLHAPAPYLIRQGLTLPAGASLRLAFGLTEESSDKPGDSVRFTVRLRREGDSIELLSEVVSEATGAGAPNWRPVTVDLGAYAGQQVEIELATEATGRAGGPPEETRSAYAVWVNPVVAAPSEHDRPNIVLVIVDALRADHLGCYGYQRDTSPSLDRLSREGVLFEEAHAQATHTPASVSSLLTSRYRLSATSQLGGPGEGEYGLADTDVTLTPIRLEPSLQGTLQRAGYTTFASVGGGFLSPSLGMDSGFDWYWSAGRERVLPEQLTALRAHLGEAASPPFFLLLHSYAVHDYFRGREEPGAEFGRGYVGELTQPDRLAEAVLDTTTADLSPEDLEYIIAVYDGELLRADGYLDEFIEWTLAQPWGENTVIVVTADHGEMLGEHGWLHHGGSPRRPVVHVPLIIRYPDGRHAGRRVAEPVALVDIMPTLLDIAGAAPPPECAGQSLRPLVEGRQPGEPRPIFAECPFGALMVREGRWWYLTAAGYGIELLYDMESDPGQQVDVAAAHPQVVHRMRRLLAAMAMRSPSDAHLVIAGPRAEEMTITLECEQGFSDLFCPTLREPWDGLTDAAADQLPTEGPEERPRLLRIPVPAGNETHVVLFEPASPEATVQVSATMGGSVVGPDRFRLGRLQLTPDRVPAAVRGDAPWVVAEDPPVPQRPEAWGIWVWLAPAEKRRHTPSTASGGVVDPELLEHLRALGYLR